MIPLYHRGGPAPCGNAALWVRALQNPYELSADNVTLVDGRTPRRGDALICGTCNQPLISQWLFTSPVALPITV
jgi:hypothetical protein